MAHNLDDQFDLADSTQNKKLKKEPFNRAKSNTYATNDFDELLDNDKGIKLPSLNNKTANNNPQKSTKSFQKINLQEVNVKKGSSNQKGKYQQEQSLEEILEQSVAPYTSPLKKKTQETQSRKKINTQFLKQKEVKNEEKYEEEYEIQQNQPEQSYGQDFEPHQQKQPSPIIYNAKEQKDKGSKKNLTTLNIPKLAQKNSKPPQSVSKKIDSSARVYTRNSVRSQDRSAQSKTRTESRKEQLPNKFTSIVEKTCPNYDRAALDQLGLDKLNRENERIRNTIKKFNDELNDMINKNIMLLKGKKEEKVVAQDQIIKQLEDQIASNQTLIQTSTRDLTKLRDKEGSIKGQSYHLQLDQQISEAKASISEYSKNNTKLNSQIANQGKKLSKMDKEKNINANIPNIQIGNIKNGIANAKKDQERHEENNKKLDLKLQELIKKTAEIQQKINIQLEQAKIKGINVIVNPEFLKKGQQLKKKVQIGKQHKSKTQNLYKTKCELIVHQIDQIKALIRQIEHNKSVCQTNCQEIQSESKKTVEKARKAGKLSSEMVNSLDIIITQMERGIPSSKETDDQALLSQPKGAKKYQSLRSVEKIHPTIPVGEIQKSNDDSNAKKPVIFKKRKQQQEKLDERIWKEQKIQSPPKNDKNRQSALELAKFQDKEVERKDDQKKKPFVIKKKQRATEEQIDVPKQQVKEIHKQEPLKQETKNQAPSIAPRMMKFKRNKDEQQSKPVQSNDKNIQYISVKERENTGLKIEQKQEDQSPNIAPRRFNLKLKDRKSQQAGYTASNMQKKQQIKIEEQKKLEININKQSVPIELLPKQQLEEQKPKLNLRLRDRQRQSNKLDIKPEQKSESIKQHIEQVTAKIAITLNDNPAPLKQNNNPYAQQQQISKRERQGPLKKQKQNQSIPKQQFNIYEQAEDLTNIKELQTEQPKQIQIQVSSKEIKPSQKNIQPNQELDLNKLLGINKPQRSVQQDLLVDTKILGRKKQTKKDTNFFGELQL